MAQLYLPVLRIHQDDYPSSQMSAEIRDDKRGTILKKECDALSRLHALSFQSSCKAFDLCIQRSIADHLVFKKDRWPLWLLVRVIKYCLNYRVRHRTSLSAPF
jgi:hypothetical protein